MADEAYRQILRSADDNIYRIGMKRVVVPNNVTEGHRRLASTINTLLFDEVAPARFCPGRMCRLGTAHLDGMADCGWPVCIDHSLFHAGRKPGGCAVLSVGINVDPSFDIAAGVALGCTVHMYDHSAAAALSLRAREQGGGWSTAQKRALAAAVEAATRRRAAE